MESLSAVLEGTAGNETPCRLGAVKSNIGHLEAAAGIAGLIKIVLCMQHRRIPANLHFNELNPNISLEGTRLEIPVTSRDWTGKDGERFAGVSSFGFGGTNAHVILQDPPEPDVAKSHVSDLGNDEDNDSSRVRLLPLSARSDESLGMMADRWREFLSGNQTPPTSLDDICYTAAVRRTHHDRRLAVVGANRDELIERIEKGLKERLVTGERDAKRESDADRRTRVCLLPARGPQWHGMGRLLLSREPVYREMIERCDAELRAYADWSLLNELKRDENASRLNQTEIAQPALFALQMGLAALWDSWGISPDAIVGHSIGEVAAACFSGILTLEDAVKVVYHRGPAPSADHRSWTHGCGGSRPGGRGEDHHGLSGTPFDRGRQQPDFDHAYRRRRRPGPRAETSFPEKYILQAIAGGLCISQPADRGTPTGNDRFGGRD